MTNREQTFYFHPKRFALGLWLTLLLAALTAYAPVGIAAARAETETAEAETAEAPEAESKAAEEASQSADSAASDSNEGQSDDQQGENQPDSTSQAAEQEPEKKAAEQKDESSKSSEENKESSSEENSKEDSEADTSEPAPESEPTVEPERTMEVDPPETPPKQPVEKKDPKQEQKKEKCIIGATTTLLEKQSGLKFRARIDSGAKSCSLHVEKITIENESTKDDITERMTENIGKVISFVVKNGDGKTHILKRKIASYVIIKTSNKTEGKRRYKVPLTFLWKNMEKEVLVTLNDRRHMEYPLLIGRNFLRDDFLIDVSINSDD